ncbi:DUF397 domain-containing protein [Streptomyces sp. NPDC005438]|uniref:DUF397 domain-containing protein n=1 Tax=Streptomyces sp. NPDC005438 TaxID=3156880 RepID=UPI0033A0D37A
MRIDLSNADWRKSTYSDNGSNACVEVAAGLPGIVPVRDSKDVSLPALVASDEAWGAFLESLKA